MNCFDSSVLRPAGPKLRVGRGFLLIAARGVQSGRQNTLRVSVSGEWWERLQVGYPRGGAWLAATAPQLKNGLTIAPLPFTAEASPA